MRWVLVASLVVSGCGGEVANPRSCIDGTCTSEEFPFCDIDGSFDGTPELCIAVTCEPNTFEKCRDDIALTCNTTGTDFDLLACPLGCQDGVGCRVCEPNETVCANGAVQTCDALGNVTSSESCPLGCFEDEPRCRELVPSNGLAQFFELAMNPPDLDLVNAHFDTGTGVVRASGSEVSVPNFNAGNGTGPSIRVFVVGSLRLDGASASSSIDSDGLSGPAIAIIATKEIVIDGRFTVRATAGGLKSGCVGGAGQYFEDSDGDPVRASGSGGGGHATAGGRGGDAGPNAGGSGGEAGGNDSLVPLRGGCSSGVQNAAGGGGALQLVSQRSITVNGIIDARGNPGYPEQCGIHGACLYGGGAGGGLLLEAPEVTLAAASALIAKGGPGVGACALPPPDDSANPVVPTACSTGVNGGSGSSGSGNGGNGTSAATSPTSTYGGGGGGGSGRIRVNTRLGTYVKDSTAVEAGVSTAGVVGTR